SQAVKELEGCQATLERQRSVQVGPPKQVLNHQNIAVGHKSQVESIAVASRSLFEPARKEDAAHVLYTGPVGERLAALQIGNRGIPQPHFAFEIEPQTRAL